MEKHNEYYFIHLCDEKYRKIRRNKKTYLVSEENLKLLYENLKEEREEKMKLLSEHIACMTGQLRAVIKPSLLEENIKEFIDGNENVKHILWPLVTPAKVIDISDSITIEDYSCTDESGKKCGGFEKVSFRICYAKDKPKEDSATGYYILLDEMNTPYYNDVFEGDKYVMQFTEDTIPEFVIAEPDNMYNGKSFFGFFLGNKEFDESGLITENVINKVNLYRILQQFGALI